MPSLLSPNTFFIIFISLSC